MHELSYGNRMRQDHAMRTAHQCAGGDHRRPRRTGGAGGARSAGCRPVWTRLRRYKVLDAIVNIDMQDPAVTLVPSAQTTADDKDGMRDFSPDTVHRRRRDGFKFAQDILRPAFENLWRVPDDVAAAGGD